MDFAPIFIVGVGRSGTSLLQSMIASHTDIAVPPETSYLRRFVVPKLLERTASSKGIEAARRKVLSDQNLARIDLDLGRLFDAGLTSNLQDIDTRFYLSLVQAFTEGQGKQRFADKDPRMIEHLDLLRNIWPKSKILHIYRDPRDVLASKKKAAWAARRSFVRHVLASAAQWKMSQKFKSVANDSVYLEVQYEKLIEEPQTELHRICQWLDVKYEPDMLNFSRAATGLVSKEEYAWKKETTGPLLQGNYGKWRATLTRTEICVVESVCQMQMQACQYTASGTARARVLVLYPLTACLRVAVFVYVALKALTRARPIE